MSVRTGTTAPRHRPGRPLAGTVVVIGVLWTYSQLAIGVPQDNPGSSDAADAVTTPPVAAKALRRGLVLALERARQAAAEVGLTIPVASGHRTVAEQRAKLVEAIEKYGSREEAERWVFPPDRSMHVRGLAIDVGDGPSADWLLVNGHRFGLCQTLSWEWWHFEWRRAWERAGSCPEPVDEPEDAYVAG